MATNITNWTELQAITANMDGDYVLVNDLNSTTAGYAGIGNAWSFFGGAAFTGTLDGQNFTISNIVCVAAGAGQSPCFFRTVNGAIVKDLTISGSFTKTNTTAVGAGTFAYAITDSTVTNVKSYSTISTNSYCSGFAYIISNSVVSGCIFSGSISNSGTLGQTGGFTYQTRSSSTDNYVTDCHVINTTITTSGTTVAGSTSSGFVAQGGSNTDLVYKSYISNCSVRNTTINTTGASSATGVAAGFCDYGYLSSVIDKCYTKNIRLTESRGYKSFFVGIITGGTITNCYAEDCVSTSSVLGSYSGGFISFTGATNNPTISNCYVKNCYMIAANYVGGFVGSHIAGTITNCYAENMNLVGTGILAGGFSGAVVGGTITNCYSKNCNAIAKTRVGGFTGYLDVGTIEDCYADTIANGEADVGGFCGMYISGTTTDCYWNTDRGLLTSSQGTGKTSLELATLSTFSTWDKDINWAVMGNSMPELLFTYNTWTGAIDNDFNKAGNWFKGTIPTYNTDILFSSAYVVNCTIPNATVRNILVTSGYSGTITINGVVQCVGITQNGGTVSGTYPNYIHSEYSPVLNGGTWSIGEIPQSGIVGYVIDDILYNDFEGEFYLSVTAGGEVSFVYI